MIVCLCVCYVCKCFHDLVCVWRWVGFPALFLQSDSWGSRMLCAKHTAQHSIVQTATQHAACRSTRGGHDRCLLYIPSDAVVGVLAGVMCCVCRGCVEADGIWGLCACHVHVRQVVVALAGRGSFAHARKGARFGWAVGRLVGRVVGCGFQGCFQGWIGKGREGREGVDWWWWCYRGRSALRDMLLITVYAQMQEVPDYIYICVCVYSAE